MDTKLRIAPFWFGLVLLLVLLLVGGSATLAVVVATRLLEQYPRVVIGLIAVQAIVAIDLAILYGLIRAVQYVE